MKFFKKARPIWRKDCEKQLNSLVTFYTKIQKHDEKCIIKIAANNTYKLFVNGKVVSSGPARACVEHFRVDEIGLDSLLIDGENLISIDVNGYNLATYQSINQPAFLQAEILSGDSLVAYTHQNEGGFSASETPFRLRKTLRYSYQRAFSEAYDMAKAGDLVEIFNQPEKKLLPRGVAYPDYKVFSTETQIYSFDLKREKTDQKLKYSGDISPLYSFEKPDIDVTKLYESYTLTKSEEQYTQFAAQTGAVFTFPRELTGFVGFSAEATEDFHALLGFDEVMNYEKLNAYRMDTCNLISVSGKAGTVEFESFEPYSMKFVKIYLLSGSLENLKITLRTFENSEADGVRFSCENENINKIFEAGRETFKQNALDIFMDCPSRERAGWLCDSFFTGRAERELTGSNKIERNFLENFAIAPHYHSINEEKIIPEGMFPMCYPADHVNGIFIPNWAMWLVLELEEYNLANNDSELLKLFKPKIYKLFDYFKGFENSDGLLENLDGWVFVDWSKANQFTDGVNYPSNMMYYAALLSASRIYGDVTFVDRAEKIKEKINQQSYNGEFYVDNALRADDGSLRLTENISEACQNYAFFTGVATSESRPDLFEKFLTCFGPNRDEQTVYPNISKAQAFIGNYLRLEVLFRLGLYDELIENMEGYMLYMAEKTGTLWELIDDNASCNHGFASHVTYWLLKCYQKDKAALEKLIGKTDVTYNAV